MVVTTTSQKIFLLQVPSLMLIAEIPLQGQVSAAHASDNMPDQLFFGLD